MDTLLDLLLTVFSFIIAFLAVIWGFILALPTIISKTNYYSRIMKSIEEIRETPSKVAQLEKKISPLENELAPIIKNATEISKTPETIKAILDKIDVIEESIKKIPDTVYNKIKVRLASKFMEANSPISLNDRGKKLSKTIDASDIASKYQEKLVRKAKNKSPYQIQQSCFDFATSEILEDLEKEDNEKYKFLTDVAYDEGVEVEELMQIVGLVLRDQVLQAVNQSSENIDKDIKTSERISKKI